MYLIHAATLHYWKAIVYLLLLYCINTTFQDVFLFRDAALGPVVNMQHGHVAITTSPLYILVKPHIGWRPSEGLTVPPSALHLIDLLLYFLQCKRESIKENLLCVYA